MTRPSIPDLLSQDTITAIADLARDRRLTDSAIAALLGLKWHHVNLTRRALGIEPSRPDRAQARRLRRDSDSGTRMESRAAGQHWQRLGVRFDDDSRAAMPEAPVRRRPETYIATQSGIALFAGVA